VAQAPVLVIHQSDELLAAMDKWNQSTHAKSGLIEKVRASTLTEEQAQAQMVEFLSQYVPAGNHHCVATRSAKTAASCFATCLS